MPLKRTTLFLLSGSLLMALLVLSHCSGEADTGQTGPEAYVGEQACASCHQAEHSDWYTSHHRLAMLPASDSSVLGDFGDVTLTADGVTSRFFQKDGKYYINTQGEDGQNHDYEVKYTFGYTPLQQYLVEFPGGRLQVPRASWDVKQKKWFHQYAGQQIPAHDWLHWTGNSQNWNTMCASCHSTNLQKHYDRSKDAYQTTYSSVNVSCESCHGPGKAHIDYVESRSYKKGKRTEGAHLWLVKGSSQTDQINTCAPCHARITALGDIAGPHHELLDAYIPEIPTTENFHADGQVNNEDYIYAAFLQSKMYKRGVTCTDCHQPHTGRLVLTGNDLCGKCHDAPTFDTPAHTFHAAGSTGSACISCHMPGKYYMGNDYRHDHSFRVPRPDLSVSYGTPNACNNCHTDQTPQWASAAVTKWFGPKRKYHFADDLVPGSRLDGNSEKHLLALLRNDSVPPIIQATAAHYLGELQTPGSLQALLKGLTHPNALVRYRSLGSLGTFPSSYWISAAAPLLTDPVRAVRIGAANLFAVLPESGIGESYRNAFKQARQELEAYLYFQADFAAGNVLLGDYFLRVKNYGQAETFYRRGLQKDSEMNYARFNLSTVYSALGKKQEAVAILQEAVKTDPENDRAYYNLALAFYEANDPASAETAFEKAVALKSANPRLYYNYGLLLNGKKDHTRAAAILKKGIELDPNSADIRYALVLVYLQSGQYEQALNGAIQLKKLAPERPDYQPLFKQFGI